MEQQITSYKDLLVWQKSMSLVILVYKLTEAYPKSEMYGLVSQVRRCVVSILSNIAEGKLRGSRKDFRQFLIIAFASGGELETQLEISKRLGYSEERLFSEVEPLLSEVMRMLNKFIGSLSSNT